MIEQNGADDSRAIYVRELPGGGYVAIGVRHADQACRSMVYVERRAKEERRGGNAPVVIAEAPGDERSAEFAELYRIAADNAAIARALLRHDAGKPARAD